MAEPTASPRWRPTRTNVVAGALVIVGFALTGLSWWYLLLVALGTIGPGVLREVGLLDDRGQLRLRRALAPLAKEPASALEDDLDARERRARLVPSEREVGR